jgi:hypothetical protein
MAKAKLSQHQQEMLSRVGVVLEVPVYKVEQYSQLQVTVFFTEVSAYRAVLA